MIQEHLNNIRKKPKAVRSQYAMVAASIFTGVLGLLWLTTLPERFAVESVDPYVQQQLAATAVAEEEKPNGVAALFGSLRDGMAALIFKTDLKVDDVPPETETKTIDIEALLRESSSVEAPSQKPEDTTVASTSTKTSATTTEQVEVGGSSGSTTTQNPETTPIGQVILIGTTSSQRTAPGTP